MTLSRFMLAVSVLLLLRRLLWLRDFADGRRLWRGGDDPAFQGDGWRWTLSLLLPNLLLRREADGYPRTLDDLVLTGQQLESCRAEWRTTQALCERWEREEQP